MEKHKDNEARHRMFCEMVDVFKSHPEAQIPTKSHSDDAGHDLYATESCVIDPLRRRTIGTGVTIAIPSGYVGLIWPRSGLAAKQGVDVLAGVIDSGYTGEICVILYNTDPNNEVSIKKGERIAQILFQQVCNFKLIQVDSCVEETSRGEGGFGSSGR